MVVDHIRNADLYRGLGERVTKALDYLAGTDFSRVEPGRHELPGGLYAAVSDYMTVPGSEKQWEAHRRYIDVQFLAHGREVLGWADVGSLTPVGDYDETSDALMLDGGGGFVDLMPGTFVILYPHDAHKPGIVAEAETTVRKVVVKVPV